ncbi:MAG TPA: multicopper oxidase domain-containing protein [Candidatus Limnocylindrales bacterium]|nr:multicopper oxidase domain-containing protein [Candidatus Limnocylindrales bacterium]
MRRLHVRLALPIVVVLVAAACSGTAAPEWRYAPNPTPNGDTAAAQPPTAPDAAAASASVLEIEAFDLGFTPKSIEVAAAGTYTVRLTNTGTIVHDVTFADGTKVEAQAGQTAEGQVTIPAGGLTFICSVPGHEQGGMTGGVTVAGQTAAAGADDHGGPLPAGQVAEDPNAPAPVRYDPIAPPVLEGTTHDIDLVITEREMTVATGFVQKVWTFGDTVPGPVIRVKLGDRVRIRLSNPASNQLPHSIDFHSSFVAWNDEMTSINPGEEKLYEFTADKAGVYMYHCGTSPALHHIANGMYGMMIVEPAGGLEPVDHEFALVQSEWYLGEQGAPADLEKAMAAAPAPDLVLFNGVANQYKDGPIEVGTGKRVRVFVLDAGPSIDSSFHVVGTIFDRVIKEGVELAVDNPGGWGSQAVDLSPAQGAIVEMVFKEDGLYPIVTHAFNFVGRGALGLFQAGDGDPLN